MCKLYEEVISASVMGAKISNFFDRVEINGNRILDSN